MWKFFPAVLPCVNPACEWLSLTASNNVLPEYCRGAYP